MARFVWQNVRLFTGGVDLTTRMNQLEVVAERETKDATAFVPEGNAWAEQLAGIASVSMSAEGQWEAGAGALDAEGWDSLGGVSAWTACPAGAADGALAYFTGALRGQYNIGGSVGDVAPWTANVAGNWPLVRGVIANPPGIARTATGNGSAFQLGAVAAGQQLYAALHVLSVAGTAAPTITVKVQSDDAQGFASPTDRLAFTAATAAGGQLLRTAGPVTDTWYRASWTITGTTPSFLAVVAIGIA